MARINYQNLPSTSTPLNATNLNSMQDIIEQGQWTPTLANANATYDQQYGLYFKIGNLVFVTWRLEGTINSVSSPGYAFINGLPFDSIINQAGSLFEYDNCFNDDTKPRMARVSDNQIGIQNGAVGGSAISFWEAGHGTFFLGGSATYLTND